MNQMQDDEQAIEDEQPEATVRGCLTGVMTVGVALLSMLGGIAASMLAINELLHPQSPSAGVALKLSALPHALMLLLRGFACQALVAFGLFIFQLHQQVRAMLPGIILTVVVAALLLLIGLTA